MLEATIRAVPLLASLWLCCPVALGQSAASLPIAFEISGDAILAPLGGQRGDAVRGRAIAFDPERGNCTICHPAPGGDPRTQGNVAPTLEGVAGRLREGQIRLRLVDATRLNPETIMPPYYRLDGLNRVGEQWRGRSILQAGEIEDVVAYLLTLR